MLADLNSWPVISQHNQILRWLLSAGGVATIMGMPVRQTQEPVTKQDLGCPRLYRGDLQEIAKAVAEVGDLVITCSGEAPGPQTRGIASYEATAPGDFDGLPEKLISVTIAASTASSGGIAVRLSPSAATAELTARSTLAEGAISHVQRVCERRRRRARSLVRWAEVGASPVVILLVLVVGVALPLGISYLIARARYLSGNGPVTFAWSTTNTLIVAFDVVLMAAVVGILLLAGRPRAMIINAPWEQRPTYWERNRDAIVVGLATGIISAIIGYLLGKFA